MTYPFVHIEISSNSLDESKQFYGNVFGWQFQDWPEMNYVTFAPAGPEATGGGFNPVNENVPAGTVTVYIGTNDIDATTANIEANGGKIILPKMEVPGVGWLAFFLDPAGNQMALIQGPSA